jgi:prephenate dehydrogenase
MNDARDFRRVAILGSGLIGTSFGAAVEGERPGISIIAYDRPEVLRKLREIRSHWETAEKLDDAVHDADLVYIALPVGAAIEILPEIAAQCGSHTLVTDACSTKARICEAARKAFGDSIKFLGGHPIAGREVHGLQSADTELFRGRRYALIGAQSGGERDPLEQRFAQLLRTIGADPVWLEADTHDWAMAVVSQMPQLAAIALARVISDETDETGLPLSLAGSGLRDLLRTAGSPFEMWRDICMTNRDNIARSLDRVAQAIDFLRTHLTSRDLENEFRSANEVHNALRETPSASRENEVRLGEAASTACTNG